MCNMIWTAWSNGSTGYGFTISPTDRDQYFDRIWETVDIELPIEKGMILVKCNIDKQSFWKPNDACVHVIHNEIGKWFRYRNVRPWPKGKPPRFNADKVGDRKFAVSVIGRAR